MHATRQRFRVEFPPYDFRVNHAPQRTVTRPAIALRRLAAALLIATAAPALARPLLIAITDSAAPFSQRNARGELTGFNVDLARELCKRLAQACRLQAMPFPDILPAVAAGKADLGMGNLLKTPERERLVRFSAPYWRSTSSFIGPHGSTLPTADDRLPQASVCAIADTRQHHYLQQLKRDGGSIVATHGNGETLDKLTRGECTLALLPTVQALPFLQSPAGREFAYVGAPRTRQQLGGDVRIALPPDDAELQQRVDAALRAMIRDGTHERLSRRYFPFSIL